MFLNMQSNLNQIFNTQVYDNQNNPITIQLGYPNQFSGTPVSTGWKLVAIN